MSVERIPVPFSRRETLWLTIDTIHSRVRGKAYEYFIERGSVDGHDLEDWLRAESQLIRKPEITMKTFNEDILIEAQISQADLQKLSLTLTDSEILIASEPDEAQSQLFRVVRLPERIDLESVDAEWMDGALRVVVTIAGARERHHHIRTNVA